jgi:hypothetical protein
MHSYIHMNQNPKTQTIYIIIETIRQQKKGLQLKRKLDLISSTFQLEWLIFKSILGFLIVYFFIGQKCKLCICKIIHLLIYQGDMTM